MVLTIKGQLMKNKVTKIVKVEIYLVDNGWNVYIRRALDDQDEHMVFNTKARMVKYLEKYL